MGSNVHVACSHMRVAGSSKGQGPHKVKALSPEPHARCSFQQLLSPGVGMLHVHITKHGNSGSRWFLRNIFNEKQKRLKQYIASDRNIGTIGRMRKSILCNTNFR